MSRNVTESISMMLATETVSLGELLDARMFLEVPLAGLAAANATEETAAALQAAIDEAADHEPGTPPFNEADKRFHQILAAAAGNELLLSFTGWILDVLQPHLIEEISPRVDGAEILRQHRDIQRAVRRRQSAGAERAMRAHIAYLMDVPAGGGGPRPLRGAYGRSKAASKATVDGEKSVARTNASASGAPQSRSMPESSHSIESGPW